ncbi:MAG: hypothetical protein V4603_13275 [Pseudomonadota bacterium]
MKTRWSAWLSKLALSWAPVVLALPGVVHAQFLSATTPVEQQYVDLIEQGQDSDGLTAPTLIEPLTALGLQYYQRKDYDLAATMFGRARQITRVNEGFNTPQEIPLLEHLIRTEEARRNFTEAWRHEQTLLQLAQQHVGELASLPVFRDAARRRLDLRQQYLNGVHPPQIELGCYYGWSLYFSTLRVRGVMTEPTPEKLKNCSAGERDTVSAALLVEARHYQLLALEALLQNNRYASEETWELLTDMLWTSEVILRKLPLFDDKPLQTTMARLLNYAATDEASAVRRAQILLQLTDMKVTRARQLGSHVDHDKVLTNYELAYDELQRASPDQTTLAATFAPSVPIALPSYLPNPLTLVTAANAVGYIDVAFDITDQGRGKHITIVAASDGVGRTAERDLKLLIERSSFRPQVRDGEVLNSAPVAIRYYLDANARGLDLDMLASGSVMPPTAMQDVAGLGINDETGK